MHIWLLEFWKRYYFSVNTKIKPMTGISSPKGIKFWSIQKIKWHNELLNLRICLSKLKAANIILYIISKDANHHNTMTRGQFTIWRSDGPMQGCYINWNAGIVLISIPVLLAEYLSNSLEQPCSCLCNGTIKYRQKY